MVLLVKGILDQIDEIADLLAQAGRAKIGKEVLREMCSVIHELDEESRELYFDILLAVGARPKKPRRRTLTEEYAEVVGEKRRTLLKKVQSYLPSHAA